MRLSSCVVWRYRDWENFRADCPGGDPALQRTVWEGLDDALAWLESLGAPVVAPGTGQPADDRPALRSGGPDPCAGARDVRLGEPLDAVPDGVPTILATGGFQGDPGLVRRYITAEPVVLGANPWSTGDGLQAGARAGSGALGRDG